MNYERRSENLYIFRVWTSRFLRTIEEVDKRILRIREHSHVNCIRIIGRDNSPRTMATIARVHVDWFFLFLFVCLLTKYG